MTEYTTADADIVAAVRAQIEANHVNRLGAARIAIICRDRASSRKGRDVLADASIPNAKLKPLLDGDYHFVICVALDTWDAADDDMRAALIDHELCHCAFDGDGKAYIRAHDIEDFAEVIERHGVNWCDDPFRAEVQQALFPTCGGGVTAPVLRMHAAGKAVGE